MATPEETQAQEDLQQASARVAPAVAVAIAAGVVLSAEDQEFPDAPVDVARGILYRLVRFPAVLVTQISMQSIFSARWPWAKKPGHEVISAGTEAGREAGMRVMTSVAQHAAAVALKTPPTESDMDAFRRVLTHSEEPPASIADYGGVPLMAQASAHAIQNSAASAAAAAAGMTHKTWNSRQDRKVRPTHAVLDSHAWPEHTVPIDSPFPSPGGSSLMFPGDPEAPLEEIANCRCWLTFSTPKRGKSYGETADLATNPPQMQGNPSRLNP